VTGVVLVCTFVGVFTSSFWTSPEKFIWLLEIVAR
jgi:hypothetical protein